MHTVVRKELGYLLLVLLLILGSLFALFTFIATTPVNEAMGISLFVAATILLIGGYMVGLMVLALLGITLLAERSGKITPQNPSKPK